VKTGALSLEDMAITVLEEKTINTQAMIRLFSELERKQKQEQFIALLIMPPTTIAGCLPRI